ncbi:GAP1-N1 domain-containing protein [Burkholderia ambifaria]|uniref:GAP1-N1 domain-containing protein n=1 Tax=Burkholderia ambifaria TaxID=152480 RepID=UPI00158B75BD|nr:hypothetical protein [Burkholderia ambifaria]
MSSSNITFPIRAAYGEIDHTHGLLHCSTPGVTLPSSLLALTDKPPGHTGPDEPWGPSVGCGPVDDWWALWWTEPDDTASRAGMGRSEVALWSRDRVADVHDLSTHLLELNGGRDIGTPKPLVVAAIAEILIETKQVAPVFGDISLWPGLLAALWSRLWPQARRVFSARVAISPPQTGGSVCPPWLYAVDERRLVEWVNHPIVRPNGPEPEHLSRAACWFMGRPEPVFDEVMQANLNLGSSPSVLRRLGRIADRLDAMRGGPDPGSGVDLLRTLATFQSDVPKFEKFKQEAVDTLIVTLPHAAEGVVMSLANINIASIPDGAKLQVAVQKWAQVQLPREPFTDTAMMLARLEEGSAEQWWLTAIKTGIVDGIVGAGAIWARYLTTWLSEKLHGTLLRTLGVATTTTEAMVVDIAMSTDVPLPAAANLLNNARMLGWSRLHAAATVACFDPLEALQSQLGFKPDPEPGLAIMVDRIAGGDLVDATIRLNDARLAAAVGTRTTRDPMLITGMSLSIPIWRSLWEAHVQNGGAPWPEPVDRRTEAAKYLESIVSRTYAAGIVSRLKGDFAAAALDLPDRSRLWSALSPSDASELALETASLLLAECDRRADLGVPEPFLLEFVKTVASKRGLSAAQAAYLLEWDLHPNEYRATELLRKITSWSVGSDRLGTFFQRHYWRMAARDLVRLYQIGNFSVLPALHACYDLLDFFAKCKVPPPSGSDVKPIDREQLISLVATLGAQVAYDRLDHIWVMAGGKGSLLPSGKTPEMRWRLAAQAADTGSLRGGLLSLVHALLVELPENDDLKELRAMLQELERMGR